MENLTPKPRAVIQRADMGGNSSRPAERRVRPCAFGAARRAARRSAQRVHELPPAGSQEIRDRHESSRWARQALEILEEVRAGQPFWRCSATASNARCKKRIATCPIPTSPGLRSASSTRSLPTRATPIGVNPRRRLRLATWSTATCSFWPSSNRRLTSLNTPGLPRPGTLTYLGVQAELRKLDTLVDAVSDVLVAESVYQLARGNVEGSLGR